MGENIVQVHHPLGQGGTCDIYYGSFNNKESAIKILRPKQKYKSKEKYQLTKAHIYSESLILQNLTHPNIVSLLNPSCKGKLIDNKGNIESRHFFLLEYLEGGELISYTQTGVFTEDELKFYGLQILEGLVYLHSKGWAHCDIKPDNIVLTKDLALAKLIDFGFCSSFINHSELQEKGTVEYLSPEINARIPCDLSKADVFALGVTFFGLLTGHFPCFKACRRFDPFYRLLYEGRYREFWRKMNRKNVLSKECKTLLQDMLHPNENKRPSMEELKTYPWFTIEKVNEKKVIEGMNVRKIKMQCINNQSAGISHNN